MDKELLKKLAKRIKELRSKMGLSQSKLAGRLGVRQNTISGWESGAREPDINMLKRLSHELGCTVDELLEPDGAAADEATGTEN